MASVMDESSMEHCGKIVPEESQTFGGKICNIATLSSKNPT